MVQVKNSSIQGDLDTIGSLITSDCWENINRAPLIGFMQSVLVVGAVMMTRSPPSGLSLRYKNYILHACARMFSLAAVAMWDGCILGRLSTIHILSAGNNNTVSALVVSYRDQDLKILDR
eukprot:354921-Chlamydomonas_euryale.AAC.12